MKITVSNTEILTRKTDIYTHILIYQIELFIRFRSVFSFGLQTYYLIDFSKIYRLKRLEPKNKGLMKSYERFEFTWLISGPPENNAWFI